MSFIGLLIIVALIIMISKKTKKYNELNREHKKREEKFKKIENLEEKISSLKIETKKWEEAKENLKVLNKKMQNKIDVLFTENAKLKTEKQNIVNAIDKLGIDYFYELPKELEDIPLTIEDGIYEIDDWNEIDSTGLLNQLKELKAKEKQSSKDGRANLNGRFPEFLDDKYKEKLMISVRKLVLRTFNGEADAAIAKVTHRNIEMTHKRIQKSFDDLQKLSGFFGCRVSIPYMKYKMKEADLVFDYELKKQQEKEEQRAIREQMREEEKARKEIEKAQKDALMEERKALDALEKAKKELAEAHGEKVDKLKEKLAFLERQLEEAQENNQRATSMAQLTKSGHVYVISNIGSFGEEVYKIGMTRRLDPLDRVKELGDASVPFKFDVHAMIYSENAPELENILHREFDTERMNKVNRRKEFFKVDLNEIKEKVEKNHGEFHLTKLAEAAEYRKTIELEKGILAKNN